MIQWAAHSLRQAISIHSDIERMVYRLSESKKEKNNRMFMRKMSRIHGR